METVLLDLTPHQRRKLRKGLQFQIKHAQIGTGAQLLMCPTKAKKLHTAKRRSKGSRLSLSPEELQASGVKPLVRKALVKALQVGLPLATATAGFPELSPVVKVVADQFAEKAINKLGDKMGFGGKGKKGKKQFKLADDYSTFIPPSHPSMNPTLVSMETDKKQVKRVGRGSAMATTEVPAMNPAVVSMETTGRGRKRGGSFRAHGVKGGSFALN